MPRQYPSHFRRFMDGIPTMDPALCWEWPHQRNSKGYGCSGSTGTGTTLVHRAVYIKLRGAIPDGTELDHLCRNRACCNPDHLEPVSHRTNVLRGEGRAAINATKTHCRNGHAFTAENTRHDPRGRACRICARAAGRRHYKKKQPRFYIMCAQGHAITPETTYVNPATGSRSCLVCRKIRNTARSRRDTESAHSKAPSK